MNTKEVVVLSNQQMLFSEAMEILDKPESHTGDELIHASLVVEGVAFIIQERLKKSKPHISVAVGDKKYVKATTFGATIFAQNVETVSVSLSNKDKDYILNNPALFQDYITKSISGPAVRKAVLAGTFPQVDGNDVKSIVDNVLVLSGEYDKKKK